MNYTKIAFKLLCLMTFILGGLYPLSMMGVAFFTSPQHIIYEHNKPVGSFLLRYAPKGEAYFHSLQAMTSQLDPFLTPHEVHTQIPNIAQMRGLGMEHILAWVDLFSHRDRFGSGVLINGHLLNRMLDRIAPLN